MALNPPSNDPFMQHIRSTFGTERVVVVHNAGTPDEQRLEMEAHVQPDLAFFEVTAPINDGDTIEVPDPRGGMMTRWVTKVDVFNAPGMGARMNHIEAHIANREPQAESSPHTQVVHGDVINVSGSGVNVSTRGGSVSQSFAVPPAYEHIARALMDALKLVNDHNDWDTYDRRAADEASGAVLEEVVKEAPDETVVNRALATMRGILTSATSAAASASASALIQQLMLRH